jgi:general secretion pathway protein G
MLMEKAMLAKNRKRTAFTLVEILIVVIIMGILAAIIISLFNNTTSDASTNSLRDNLRGMRSALQIYLAQHGTYPAPATFAEQMTLYSDGDGNTSPTPSATYKYGPYIVRVPPLPVGLNKGKTQVTSTGYADGYGWQYDAATGDFRANCTPTETDSEGIAYQTF